MKILLPKTGQNWIVPILPMSQFSQSKTITSNLAVYHQIYIFNHGEHFSQAFYIWILGDNCTQGDQYNSGSSRKCSLSDGIEKTRFWWQFSRYFWIKYDIGQKYYAPQVQPDWGSNTWPPDHDSTFHVTGMPALTTWPSVTSACYTRVSKNFRLTHTYGTC